MEVRVSKILKKLDEIREKIYLTSFVDELKLLILDWYEWEIITYCKGNENKKISEKDLNKIRNKIAKEIRNNFIYV